MATKPAISDTALPPASRAGRGFSWRVFAITYGAFLLMIAVAAVCVGYWAHEHLKPALQQEITRNLVQKAQMLSDRVNADRTHGIEVIASQEGQAAGARATIIDTNGRAVADSEVPLSALEGEGRLPEFAAALRGATGIQTRSRNGVQVLFVAVPVSGGAVRLACPLSDVEIAVNQVTKKLLIACILAALAGLALSVLVSRAAVRR